MIEKINQINELYLYLSACSTFTREARLITIGGINYLNISDGNTLVYCVLEDFKGEYNLLLDLPNLTQSIKNLKKEKEISIEITEESINIYGGKKKYNFPNINDFDSESGKTQLVKSLGYDVDCKLKIKYCDFVEGIDSLLFKETSPTTKKVLFEYSDMLYLKDFQLTKGNSIISVESEPISDEQDAVKINYYLMERIIKSIKGLSDELIIYIKKDHPFKLEIKGMSIFLGPLIE